MENVEITTEYIKLEQLLKLTGSAGSGSDAKAVISDGLVKVNGSIELKRGKKLRKGDIIEYGGKKYQVE
jgi:ribosome-associated protein